MPRPAARALITASLCLWATAARADDIQSFQTPSGNIHCQMISGDEGALVDCEMIEITRRTTDTAKPADCDLDWGNRFSLASEREADMTCYGDTLRNADAPVLAYGKSMTAADITCTSRAKALTCSNGGHSFSLSKTSQTLD